MILTALTLAVAAAAAPPSAALDGIALSSNVTAVIRSRGNPDVNNTDVGHVWNWSAKDGTAVYVTTDDDGLVKVVDVRAGATNHSVIAVPVLGSFQFGDGGRANAQFAAKEQPNIFTGNFLGFPVTPDRELVLTFDGPSGGPMREVFLGERAWLSHILVIPGGPAAHASKAPVLQRLGGADYASPKEGTAYVRIAVRADGAVTGATIFASSGDAQLDRVAIASALHDTFTPASLDGKPVAGVYFHREDFVQTHPR